MVTWYKVAWIPPLFEALDAIAPRRDHASDGTIGDLIHASGRSGHNPDDTVLPQGGTAERADADSRPEVRAADLDSDLRQPGINMGAVVAAVLDEPADRDRLIYIIYMGKIYKKANGWQRETYTGDDPHIEHAHFSGDPASDDDGRPWLSILRLGVDMAALQPSDPSYIDLIYRVEGLLANADRSGPGTKHETNGLAKAVSKLQATLDEVVQLLSAAPAPPTGATLTDLDVERIARAVLDEEHRRTAD